MIKPEETGQAERAAIVAYVRDYGERTRAEGLVRRRPKLIVSGDALLMMASDLEVGFHLDPDLAPNPPPR